ncbi:MAG: DUF11 domain-containing protein [Thiotrichaceae bacterium]|nr:DUF11 domain-containing protein [Thiotrichaceae bacterium]
MIKKIAIAMAFAGAIGTVATVAAKKTSAPLTSDMKAFVVHTNAKGQERLSAVKTAEPGETLQYQLTYKNNSKQSLTGLIVTGPIPANTHFIGKSTHTRVNASLLVSIDGGGKFEQEPVKRLRKMPNGKEKMVIIPAEKYTHVRWKANSELSAGKKQTFNYRVRVN